jgi:hypothetical protein
VRQLDEAVYFGNALGDMTFTDVSSPADGLYDITFLVDGTIAGMTEPRQVVIRTDWEIAKPSYTIDFNRTGQLQAR